MAVVVLNKPTVFGDGGPQDQQGVLENISRGYRPGGSNLEEPRWLYHCQSSVKAHRVLPAPDVHL